MAEEKLLTVRDVAHILKLTEKEVIDFAENGTIPAYKVGGVYLRFKREQVEQFKKKNPLPVHAVIHPSFKDRFVDFFYFNDFYILSVLLILVLLYIIFK